MGNPQRGQKQEIYKQKILYYVKQSQPYDETSSLLLPTRVRYRYYKNVTFSGGKYNF